MLRALHILIAILVITQLVHTADFQRAVEKTLKNEGGYANKSSDNGGETYRGVARKFHANWEGWKIVDSAKALLGYGSTVNCSAKARRAIDKSLDKDKQLPHLLEVFYKKEFWDPLNLDREPDQQIADKIFDAAVLSGVAFAKKIYREAIEGVH
jgi:lysozyme family protein